MRAALIGLGRMGRRHLQVMKDLGLEIAGIADLHAESLAAAGDESGVPAAARFTDPLKMLADVKAECVVIATTAPAHCEQVLAAAANGAKKILCEKPMAVSLEQCDRMIEACRKAGAKLAINHQMRVMEQYTVPKAMVDAPEFGGLSSLNVVAGNFGLAMNGTHYFEAFRFLAGEAASEVTAWFSADAVPNPRGPQFEDRGGVIVARTASGKRFFLDASTDHGHGMQAIYAGPYGHLLVDELDGFLRLTVREAAHRALPSTRYGMPHAVTTRTITPADALAPTRAVLDALLRDGNACTGEEGRLAVATLVAAYVSHEEGHRPVKLSEKLPLARVFPWA